MEPFSPARPRTSLAPLKITSQNHIQKFPVSLAVLFGAYASHSNRSPPSLGCVLVGLRVTIFCSSPPLQDLGCATPSLHVEVQDPYAALHWITVSWRQEAREARIPAWGPPSRSGLPTLQGLSPWRAWHLLVPRVFLSMPGARTRDSEHPSAPVTKHPKPKFHEPRAKREPIAVSSAKGQRGLLPTFCFKKSSLLESHVLWKLVEVSSFLTNGHVCLCPFFQAWAEVSSHPGWGFQPPKLL